MSHGLQHRFRINFLTIYFILSDVSINCIKRNVLSYAKKNFSRFVELLYFLEDAVVYEISCKSVSVPSLP